MRPRRGDRIAPVLAIGLAALAAVAPKALGEAHGGSEAVRPTAAEAPATRRGEYDDPFVAFEAIRPLFVRSEDGAQYEVASSRRRCFQAQSFPARKAAGEFRIFCLGGSTVWGRPYADETSFTTWLEMNLRLADPARAWRVINCGGISYASYRVVPILKEVLGHGADLIVLYTGQNEFLEERRYDPNGPAGAGPKPVLKADVEAMLDYKGGRDKYHRDETWRRGVIEHFEFSVRRMVRMARAAGVPILLMNPVSNLRDCPPFKSQHRDGLTAPQLRRWAALVREAEADAGLPSRTLRLYRDALAIDEQYADLHFRQADKLYELGRVAEARAAYEKARELDVCPLRIVEPMHEAILAIARENRLGLVDVRKHVEKRCADGIPGDTHLADHVHPRIAVHRSIADLLIDEMARRGLLRPQPGWRLRQQQEAYRHLASLHAMYYQNGVLRLYALKGWAAGLVDLAPPKPKARP